MSSTVTWKMDLICALLELVVQACRMFALSFLSYPMTVVLLGLHVHRALILLIVNFLLIFLTITSLMASTPFMAELFQAWNTLMQLNGENLRKTLIE